MEEALFFHPWQAFPVSIYQLQPGRRLTSFGSERYGWLPETCELLEELLTTGYDYFRVVPIFDSRKAFRYDEYMRVGT
jgi:hypothetical protein